MGNGQGKEKRRGKRGEGPSKGREENAERLKGTTAKDEG
jgi:hypothetical protein